MTEAEVKALFNAAKAAGLKTSELKAVNPWTQTGKKASLMQLAVEALDPMAAAGFKQQAGVEVSLEATAARMGITQATPQIHQELMGVDPAYAAAAHQQAIDAEAEYLKRMTAAVEERVKARGEIPGEPGYTGPLADAARRQWHHEQARASYEREAMARRAANSPTR